MVLNLIADTDPRMRTVSESFDFQNPQMDPVELYNNLVDTMIAHRGVGLSAIQVGIPLRVFVFGNPDDRESIIPAFNPKIVSFSDEKDYYEEGCLTFKGLWVKIKRPLGIRVRFSNYENVTTTQKFSGMTARIFQHEYDHLDGLTFKQRASKIHLERALRQSRKLKRK